MCFIYYIVCLTVLTNSMMDGMLQRRGAGYDGKRLTVCCYVFQGLICYKPVDQDSCFLQNMETSDYENVHSLLSESTHKVTAGDISTREN